MASNFKISTASRNAACDAIVDLVDGGASAGRIDIWMGTIRSDPQAADDVGGNKLASITLQDPAFGAASAGAASALGVPLSDTSADNTGDATYFRVYDSNNNVIFQGTAGESGDTPDLTFDNKSIVQTGTVTLTALTVTVPEQ